MKNLILRAKTIVPSLSAGMAIAVLLLPLCSNAWPLGRTTFYTDQPFVGTNNIHSLAATGMQNLLTVSAWADADATIPANLSQWWWIFGVDSGPGNGNGALLDGNESMTLDFDKSVGAAMITFLYTGGGGGTTNNLARLSISGFASDPASTAVTWNSPRISNLNYSNGTLTFDYLNDGPGSDYGQLMFANPAATAGRTLKITGAVSPNGDATTWFAALYGVDVQEAFAGPNVSATSIPLNSTTSFTTSDSKLIIRGYSDRNATTPGNLGRDQDECFGVYGQHGGNVVDTNEAVTLQFTAGTGLSRIDSVYSGGEFSISGFTSDPGFVDPSFGASSFFYNNGVLTVTVANGGMHSFYFANRAASAGQTLRITVGESDGNQLGIGGIGYAKLQTMLGPDIAGNFSTSYTTPDAGLTLSAFSDTPGTVPAALDENVDWFGVGGGNNNEAIEGAESMTLQFAATSGLSALGTRYTSGQVIISGFTSDPGFNDPSGTATGVSYAAGTLTYTFNAPSSPERVVKFNNPAASQGQSLSLHTDGNAGSQIALTRIEYCSGDVRLTITQIGNDVVVSWPFGTLESSTSITGSYDTLTGVTSPYTNAITPGSKFFRVKIQ